MEKSTYMYRKKIWKDTKARHASEARAVNEAISHSRNQVSGIVRARLEHQDREEDEEQMDTSLVPSDYDFSKSKDQIWTHSAEQHTLVRFQFPITDIGTKESPTVFEIARMTTRTYRARGRNFIGDSENDNERHVDSVTYRNNRNLEKQPTPNYLDDEPPQPYSINTVHLQNPYRAPQKLEGFSSRNSTFKVRSRFLQKGSHRSRNNNHLTGRRELSTVNLHDDNDADNSSSSRSRKKAFRLYVKNMAIAETAKQYCTNSSLHGLRYIGDESLTTFEKLFWFVAFIAAVLSAGYFIQHLYQKWNDSPIIISMNPEPMAFTQFPFPAVTVCNMNNVKRSEANRINRGDNKLEKLLLEDLCDFNNNTIEDEAYGLTNFNNVLQFMINTSQPCKAMLTTCKWHGNETNCEHIFNPTMTDEGICCNFNSVPRKYLFYDPRDWSDLNITDLYPSMDWKPETGYDPSIPADVVPWRPYGAGKYFGLTLVLDAELHEYYCSSTASMGFKMFLHNPVETPKIADFAFTITPGRETRIVIKPQITSASQTILRVPGNKRKCFFNSERKLRYYRTYTQKNCLLECEANFTQKMCYCVQYYMPKSSNTKICGKKDDSCANRARRAMEYKLYDEDIAMNQLNITETPSCRCLPACAEMNYDSAMTSSRLSTTFEIDPEYLKDKTQKYFAENMAVVHLFFVDSQFPNYVKSELFGFIEFLSSTGGLLGLFMGFSFLSVAEIVYFITIRIWCRLHGHHGKIHVVPANNHKVIYPFAQ